MATAFVILALAAATMAACGGDANDDDGDGNAGRVAQRWSRSAVSEGGRSVKLFFATNPATRIIGAEVRSGSDAVRIALVAEPPGSPSTAALAARCVEVPLAEPPGDRRIIDDAQRFVRAISSQGAPVATPEAECVPVERLGA